MERKEKFHLLKGHQKVRKVKMKIMTMNSRKKIQKRLQRKMIKRGSRKYRVKVKKSMIVQSLKVMKMMKKVLTFLIT